MREIVYIDKLETQRAVRMYSSIGKRVPIHATPLGKAILAYLPEDKWRQIKEDTELTEYTPNTTTSLTEPTSKLKSIRHQGYAIDNAEHEEEIRCIATPIRNHSGSIIAALSATFPSIRVSCEDMEDFHRL